MFLFLSKLLPLLIYPLGLVSVSLLLGWFWLHRRPRRTAIALGFSLGLLWLGSNAWVATALVQSLEWQNLPPAELPTAEAIVVLGGSLKPATPPRPWVDVAESGDRVLHGARLFKAGKAPVLILSGGRINWQEGGAPESADMALLLQELGIPAEVMWQDPTSLNTYQNAVQVKQLLHDHDINRVLLVTSAMHMPRSLAIFAKQGIEAIAAPTDFLVTTRSYEELTATWEGLILGLLPDAENLYHTSRALKEYVGLAVYRLRGWL